MQEEFTYKQALDDFQLNESVDAVKEFITPSVEMHFVAVGTNFVEAVEEEVRHPTEGGMEYLKKIPYDILMTGYASALKWGSEVTKHAMTETKLIYYLSILFEHYARTHGIPRWFDAHFWLLSHSLVEMFEGLDELQSRLALGESFNRDVFKAKEIEEDIEYSKMLVSVAIERYLPVATQYLEDFPGEIDFSEDFFVSEH